MAAILQWRVPAPECAIDMSTIALLFLVLAGSLQGVGAKTARHLVQAFGPVEQVCQQLAAMPEDKQKQVRTMQPAAHMRYVTYLEPFLQRWSAPLLLQCCTRWLVDLKHTRKGVKQTCSLDFVLLGILVVCCVWLLRQVVKLNKPQRAVLLSEEGRLAAAFMKELVTINTHLKAPPCQ